MVKAALSENSHRTAAAILVGPAHAADRLLGDDGGAAYVGVAGDAAHHLDVDDAGADGVPLQRRLLLRGARPELARSAR